VIFTALWVLLAVAGVTVQIVMVSLTSADLRWARQEHYGRRAVIMTRIFFRNAVIRLAACAINLAIGAPGFFIPQPPAPRDVSNALRLYGAAAIFGLLAVEGLLVLMSYLELRDRRTLLTLATLEADALIGTEPDPALAIDEMVGKR
jgi:hypothetical protein